MLAGTALEVLAFLTSVQAAEFPIGLYDVSAAVDCPAVAEAGFTVVRLGAAAPAEQSALARAAKSAGLSVIGHPRPLMEHPASETSSWPLTAWYTFDEPDVNRVSTAAVAEFHQRVKAWDPGRKQVLVVADGRRAAEFAPWTDAVLVDWYPVPHMPLTGVAEHVDAARAGAGGKPIWAVVQAMDWRDFPQRDPTKPRIGRFPDFRELRFMTYQALVHGARGLLYYTFKKPGGGTLLDYPEQWQALARMAGELKRIKPFLDSGEGEALPVEGLQARRWRRWGKELIVVVNASSKPQTLPESLAGGSYLAVFEPRLDPRDVWPGGALPAQRVLVLTR